MMLKMRDSKSEAHRKIQNIETNVKISTLPNIFIPESANVDVGTPEGAALVFGSTLAMWKFPHALALLVWITNRTKNNNHLGQLYTGF